MEFVARRQKDELVAEHTHRSSPDHVTCNSSTQNDPLKPAYDDAPRQGLHRIGNCENGSSKQYSAAESAYQTSCPTQSPLHSQAFQGRLGRKLGSASPAWEKKTACSSPVTHAIPGRVRVDRGAALPKFGNWDPNDPSSAEDFSAIFDKARDEKKAGGVVSISVVPADFTVGIKSQGDHHKQLFASRESASLSSWLCCCFRSS
eukprot:c24145_g1_i1 orf=413-1021(-)